MQTGMRRGLRWALACLLLVAALAPLGPNAAAAETIRFIVTDLEGLEEVQREFGPFRDLLEEKTGLEIEFFPVTSRTAAVEALRAKKADFVLTGPAEYVVIQKLTEAEPVIGFSRPDYFGSIIVLSDSGINTIQDLRGRKVAFGDVGSTSNHLAPMQVVADYGLNPMRDLEVIHTDRKIAWESLKRGDIAAIGMNNGKFMGMREDETQLEPGAFKVIGRGPDLPNDVLVAAAHVDRNVVESVRTAIAENSDALIREILKGEDNQKYRGMKFLPLVKDEDYNYIRAAYATIGKPQFAEFVGD